MRITTAILTTVLLAGVSSAQVAPASQAVKPNAPETKVQTGPSSLKSPFVPRKVTKSAPPAKTPQSAAQHLAKPAVAKKSAQSQGAAQHLAKPAIAKKSAQAAAAKPHANTKAKAQTAVAKPIAKPPAKSAEAAPAEAQSVPAKPSVNPGKRDPFISPIAAAALRNGPASNCTTGKRCLVVDQIALKGIVQMKNGNFALVENSARRPYVLRENDSLFNGSVVKITGDSVVFKENGNDILGRPTSKEVIKKVSAPAV